MKHPVSSDIRKQVLNLRRNHSLREVAERTGLPLGTVKTICSRSGAFRDNLAHRALFSLPPIRQSNRTALTVPELPPKNSVTGDDEIDAVLWLREVIGTGQAALIDKAMLAVKKITTPLKDLEDRYMKPLVSSGHNQFTVMFSVIGFCDFEELAKRSTRKLTLSNNAIARFGDVDTLFSKTEAEMFCVKAMAGLKVKKGDIFLDDAQVDKRFTACHKLMPHTLSDCLYELAYWSELYSMRNAIGGCGDLSQEALARDMFAFRCLAKIRPRNKDEAVAVFRYIAENEYMDRGETNNILLNLIG